MKRAAMIRGPRRSAKQTVITFMNQCFKALDMPDLPPDRRKEFRNHLGAILVISRNMNWTDITTRVTKYVRSTSIETGSYEGDKNGPIAYSKRGVFTEPE